MNTTKNTLLAMSVALCLCFCQNATSKETVTNVKPAQENDDYVPSRTLADDKMSDTLRYYLQTCRSEWLNDHPVISDSLTNVSYTKWKVDSEYKIVYDDDRFISFWADEWLHGNGNCSSNKLSVGTLLRSTGKRIHLKDLYRTPAEKQKLQKAWETAVARGNFWYSQKEYNPDTQLDKLEHPFMTDNFFIKGKEIHFIYQKGEVAANCYAAVEVVIPHWECGILADED